MRIFPRTDKTKQQKQNFFSQSVTNQAQRLGSEKFYPSA
jgi:hypothetical protein